MKKLITFIAFVFVACSANAQSCPDDNHPHAIDLGLPSGTKWACCNVGASIPEGSGGYYAWGETKEKEIYDWTTYIHCDGDLETCHDLGSDIAGSEYDVAHVQWGGFWVMPTQEQIQELTSNCSCTWTRRNGVNGDLFTGPNGCTVFLPESDFWRKGRDKGGIDVFNGETDELPCAGYYWSSTLNPSNSNSFSSYLLTSYGKAYWDHYNFRSTGLTVRPVVSETNSIYVPVSSSDKFSQTIYNLYGMKVADNAAETSTLPSGIYIVNGKKMVVK